MSPTRKEPQYTKLCSTCLRRVEAEQEPTSDVVATGELTVPFCLCGGTLTLALPADQLRELLTAHDEAERQSARDRAEAHFTQTSDKTDTSSQ